ncbi:MAG TPA: SCP2 sterol-binding domain-containing protein [Castellaniella sp.]
MRPKTSTLKPFSSLMAGYTGCAIMPVPFLFPRPSALLLQGINALLRREAWARERLSGHTGKSLRVAVGQWVLQASVASDGFLQACDAAVVPDVTVSVPAERLKELPRVWREQGQSGVVGLMHIQGDAGLAHLMSDLAQSLRWDVEQDLSRVVGDVLAVRLVSGARQFVAAARQTAQRARDNVSEYLAEESDLLVRPAEFRAWSEQGRGLADRLDGLERRLCHLEQAC